MPGFCTFGSFAVSSFPQTTESLYHLRLKFRHRSARWISQTLFQTCITLGLYTNTCRDLPKSVARDATGRRSSCCGARSEVPTSIFFLCANAMLIFLHVSRLFREQKGVQARLVLRALWDARGLQVPLDLPDHAGPPDRRGLPDQKGLPAQTPQLYPKMDHHQKITEHREMKIAVRLYIDLPDARGQNCFFRDALFALHSTQIMQHIPESRLQRLNFGEKRSRVHLAKRRNKISFGKKRFH